MLEEKLPKDKYDKSVAPYLNLEDRANGMCIPLLWGEKTNITPVCKDITTFTFKISNRTIKSIDVVRVDGVANNEYTPLLASAEFTFINVPFLSAATTYWLVLEATFGVDPLNYLEIVGDPTGIGAPGPRYEINAGGVWTSVAPIAMYFEVWGKDTLDDNEEKKVEYPLNGLYGTWTDCDFKDDAARTRVAQEFVTPAGAGFYITKVFLGFLSVGNPSGNLKAAVLSAYLPAEVQIGCKSNNGTVPNPSDDYFHFMQIIPESSKISVDASGVKNPDDSLMTNVADIIQDIYVNLLEGLVTDLNAVDFAALKLARTEELAIWLDKETSFGEIIEKLEAGQLFKFLQNIAGEYTVKYYAAGDTSGIHVYQDEDFISFESHRNLSTVYQKVKVKYDEDPSTQEWLIEEETSEIARFFYRNNKTLEVETYLKDLADALQLAEDYLGTDIGSSRRVYLQYPQRTIKFELQVGLGFDLIPTQKVKITRTRGDYTGGTYNAVLFRILEIEKKYNTQTVVITAVLDSLTY